LDYFPEGKCHSFKLHWLNANRFGFRALRSLRSGPWIQDTLTTTTAKCIDQDVKKNESVMMLCSKSP